MAEQLDRAAVEICGNAVDDDGDGTVDEADCQLSETSTPVSGERGVTPELWGDNPDCADLGFELGFKLDSPTSGHYGFDSDEYLDLVVDQDGKMIDWDSSLPLDAVFVKGGTGGNLYVYDPEVDSDTHLGTPALAHQISHVSFCYDHDDLCADVTCGPPPGDCYEAGVCDPDTGECTYATKSAGAACGDPSDTICDNPDTCDGAGACMPNLEPVTTLCREDSGECDVPEYCDAAGECPANGFESSGTSCGDPSDSICDNPDTCDGAGACSVNHEPATVLCREDSGECDLPEYCDASGECPANGFEQPGAACGDPSDTVCDNPDTCDGVGACMPNLEPVTTLCREDAGDCDVPEYCDAFGQCPANGSEPPGTACGDVSDSVCDNPDTCDAGGSCLPNHEPTTVVCRTRAGRCDLPERCDADGTCPVDVYQPEGTLCRPVADVCDVEEVCTGDSATCPPNGFEPAGTVCRPSVDECDPAEECTGRRAACPTDVYATCTLCGEKFYDANADATYGTEELGIAGWQVTLAGGGGTKAALSDSGGGFEFAGLTAGDYTLCESMPNEDNWMQTAPEEVCYSVHVPFDDAGLCSLDFGNLCLGAGGGHTPGFWSNQNGRAAFMDGDAGAAALALVVSLDLWKADGSAFNPGNYGDFRTWLMNRTATNAAYMLSAHEAAMELNVLRGYVLPDALIFAPGLESSDELGFATIDAILAEARAELALHGYTPAGSPYRAYQLRIESALAGANNNDNFVQPEACAHTFD